MIKFLNCSRSYNDIIEGRVFGSSLSYDDWISAIIDDMAMEHPKRKRCNNSSDFREVALSLFPPNSEAMDWVKKVLRLKYFINSKNEFIACKRRSVTRLNPDSLDDIEFVLRQDAEYNEEYVQLAAVGIVYTLDDKERPVYVLLNEKSADMAGYITFPEGHVDYQDFLEVHRKGESRIGLEAARRECHEELGLPKDKFKNRYPEEDWVQDAVRDYSKGSNLYEYIFKDLSPFTVDNFLTITKFHIGLGCTFYLTLADISAIEVESGKEVILYCPSWEPEFETHPCIIDSISGRHVDIPVYYPDNPPPSPMDSWVEPFMKNAAVIV